MSTLPSPPPAFSATELARRRAAVAALAARDGLDAVVAYGANRFGSAVPWLTGWPVTREAAVVLRDGAPVSLLVGFPNHVPNARRIARDCEVRGLGDNAGASIVAELGQVRRVGTIGPVPVALRRALDDVATVVVLDRDYGRLRSRKSAEELAWIRHAAALTDASAAALISAAVPGATELDLVAAVESSYAGTGATNYIHYVAATSMAQPDRCVPSQWPTDRRLSSGSVVVFELSTQWGHDYPGQLLRTLTVDAEPTTLYRELHGVADAALTAIVGALRPGTPLEEVRRAADVILDAGFTTVDDLVHGLGGGYLPPVLSHRNVPAAETAVIEEGMTLVVQPNVCTRDLSAGVQTGELFEITASGARSLHCFPPGMLRGGPRCGV